MRIAMQGIASAALLLSAAPALGNPLNNVCKVISKGVSELQKAPKATSFCSSYLHISTVTKAGKTVTITPTTTVVVTTDGPTDTVSAEPITTTATATAACKKRDLDARHPYPPPVPTPSCVKGKGKGVVSALCSCLNIHTPTTTVTPTVTTKPLTSTSVTTIGHTTTVTPTVTTTTTVAGDCECTGVPGFNVAVWEGDFPDEGEPTWPEFRPEYFKMVTPANSATQQDTRLAYQATPVTYNGDEDSITLYGIATPPTSKLVSFITAYFHASYANNYKFIFVRDQDSTQPDDIGFVWVGPLAYAGWNRDNADLAAYYQQPCSPGSCYASRDMEEGELIAIRVMFANRGGPGALQFAIYDEAGVNLVDKLDTQSCDGTTSPKFLPWGSEI